MRKRWGGKGALVQDDVSATLSTANSQTVFQPIGFAGKASVCAGTIRAVEEQSTTLMATRQDACACYVIPINEMMATFRQSVLCMADVNANAAIDDDMTGTLKVGGEPPIVASEYVVRHLMPVECERLQGFPDGWTDIEFRGKPASDAARYKALGNSMAVPIMRWIGERIDRIEKGES